MTEPESDLTFMVHKALELGRYEDAVRFARQLIQINPNLNHDQRIFLSSAYHEAVSRRRQDVLIISQCIEATVEEAKKVKLVEIVNRVRANIHDYCMDIIQIANEILLPAADSPITIVFYEEMKADYYRYDSEVQVGDLKIHSAQEAENCYKKALSIARDVIQPSHPVYLGIILNYCVFLVDIKNDINSAKIITQNAINQASECEEQFKPDSEICVRLLQENLEIWSEQI
ncbi:14-3-3 protein [Trichomonas vaginalis G3]|uniref:14-3-3 protein n=1 Tax=Trichomonas vaginalis (strain ATCC PRA-98 / G3) TaxID=412133 RepID=A2DFA7_TRIV3|nr:protein domain specific binding [Trichomonas vaginalis G3]EAY20835.1 14-3-3 protein [Trichomonas vaginalis G3]KAI5521557.1 protein domain specific binding [Trichomonas vaginalis G3]|eukprot:XP_001581821.1 14-3-3 protein [Trichomonas vaginalis G3]